MMSSPNETWDKGNLDLSEVKKLEMLEFEYARLALKNGLKLEQQPSVNPYKFGMIGSTDAHTSLAAAEEENVFGKDSKAWRQTAVAASQGTLSSPRASLRTWRPPSPVSGNVCPPSRNWRA
jgi:hypothetical protein